MLGGENRSGGEAANGIPRNLFTVAVADGIEVVVPTTNPESMTAVGSENDGNTKYESKRAAVKILRHDMAAAQVARNSQLSLSKKDISSD